MSRSTAIAYPLTVYYDATCRLCSAEMGAMKARDAAARLVLVDCSALDFDAGPAPREALMTAIMATIGAMLSYQAGSTESEAAMDKNNAAKGMSTIRLRYTKV